MDQMSSLSYLPLLIWVLLLTFPNCSCNNSTVLSQLMMLFLNLVAAVSCNVNFLVQLVYLPLHLHFVSSWCFVLITIAK